MLTLLDARLGRRPSGIGYYVLNLADQFGKEAPGNVRAIAHRRHRLRFRRLGVRTWAPPLTRRGVVDLPPADVVHGPNFHAPAHPTAAAVATIHDLGYLTLPECHPPGMPEQLDAVVRASLEVTELYICVSQATLNEFVDVYGVDSHRCRVVHHGVSDRFLQIEPKPAGRDARGCRPYLLHVGAMVPRKDLVTLLEAFALVASDHPDLRLVIAGHKTRRWASDWPRVERWIADHPGVGTRVDILDYVPDRDMPGLYAGAAALVTSTLLEGFGLTVLEGLATGTPVVASRLPAIQEIAGDLVHYARARDPESFAVAINAALNPLDADLAERGRAHARRFSWRQTGASTLDVYREARERRA